MPCGVLVLLSIIPESQTPEWSTQYNDEEEDRESTCFSNTKSLASEEKES
jgi:hypothetical protein